MKSIVKMSAVAGAVLLAGCATIPSGPSVAVYPGTGKSFDQFRVDDQECRQFATNQIGGTDAQQTANDSAVKSAVVGTAIGAAAGAALGGNSQAAGAGAGIGLLFGALSGANAGHASGYAMQRRYDIGYQQCMYAKGHKVPTVARAGYPQRPQPQGYYAPPPAPNSPPPAYTPPPPGAYSPPPPNTPPPPPANG
jgi:hypothetical protein